MPLLCKKGKNKIKEKIERREEKQGNGKYRQTVENITMHYLLPSILMFNFFYFYSN